MKNIILLSLIILCGCCSSNNDDTIKWIANAKKPVLVKRSDIYNCAYTLISEDGKIYVTGDVSLSLPDTLK